MLRSREQRWDASRKTFRSNSSARAGDGALGADYMIQRHGGRIWAEAAPDKGAALYFIIGR